LALFIYLCFCFHQGATEGTLTFMVGCDELASLELAQPCLDAMGQRTIHCGSAGAGSATKLCNNLALAAQMLGICEAMNLGESLGVNPVTLAQVLNTSTASSWSSKINNPHPLVAAETGSPASKNYQGGFGTKLMRKDLGLAVSAGAEAGVAMPMGVLSKELYQLAELSGLGENDFGVMLQFLRGKKP
jgi:3-hydroxyisobutyrate dehydrogenase